MTSNTNIGKKMAAMLREKIQTHERNTRCGRMDLELLDYKKVGNHDYEILVEYAPERGTPTPTQLGAWVTAEFLGSLTLNLATVRDHKEVNALRGHVQETSVPLPLERSAEMVKLGGGRFMDQHKNQWEVTRARNGENILVRKSDVRVEDILEERINRKRDGRYARVLLNQVHTAGVAGLEVGDTVLYAEPGGGQLQKTGKISSVGAKTVKIKGRQGDLPRSFVIDIVDKNAAAKKKQNKILEDFFTEYLLAGDRSLGKKLTIK